jgi:hypothetical protein
MTVKAIKIVKASQGWEECGFCAYRESEVCGECEEGDMFEEGEPEDALGQVDHLLAA